MPSGEMNDVVERLRGAALRDDGAPTDGQLLEAFVARGDGAAFEALVRRHAAMVLGVCRRVAGHAHDAEDAFQATFLVLVRKAGAVVPGEAVGNWLYGVAYRTALKARALAGRRERLQRRMTDMPQPQTTPDDRAELLRLLDRELARLPAKYRLPIVLCDLECRTRCDAARQLGLPTGTLSGRLTTARKLLAKRLARHCLAVSGTALGTTLAAQAAEVPNDVISSTIKAAALFAAGSAAAAGIVPGPAALAEGVLKTMLLTKLKLATAVLAGVVLLGAGVLAYDGPGLGPQPPARETPAKGPAKPSSIEEAKTKADLEVAKANVDLAAIDVNQAELALRKAHQQLERAQAEYQRARLRAKGEEKPRPDAGPTLVLKARGLLQPATVLQVTARVTGRVAKVLVDEGTVVKAGQVLASLESDPFRSDVERTKVKYKLAYARVQEAKAVQPDDTANKAKAAAQLDVAWAEAELALLERTRAEGQLELTDLRAPIDGIVTKRQVDVGDSVGPASGQPAARLFELIDPRILMVAVPVVEADIGKVFLGQRVRVEAGTAPGNRLEGKVARIAPTVDSSTASIMVQVALRPPTGDSGWRPGMSVIAEFQPKE